MTTNNTRVRAATEADAASLYELTNMFTPGLETSFQEFEVHLRALLQDPNWFVAVAIEHNSPTGYVAAQDYGRALRGSFSVGRIHDLFVTQSARRSGTGRSLVESAFAWAKECPSPMILDWQATPQSVSFYESLGFEADFVGDFPECPGFTLDLRVGSVR
ncbi:GNAT family N-acetyltransferase [Glutamicibacter arilaitensis]|uniref:GNAT family N-acetyltransferase n=1 Tax=Glutamicibacter arilaitensis TaxID=256701 RepID=UPI00384B89F6